MSHNKMGIIRLCLGLSLALSTLIFFRTNASGAYALGVAAVPADDPLNSIQNETETELRNIQVGELVFPIVQQPVSDPSYVSPNLDEITQFRLASEYGNIGLLAHNYFAGKLFSQLVIGDEVQLMYSDGHMENFVINEIFKFQALQPNSAYSSFRNLNTGEIITAEQLFNDVYGGNRHVTLQTCIEADGNVSWGRLFVIAIPGN